MKKARVLAVAMFLALGILSPLVGHAWSAPASNHAVMRIADEPTPTPTTSSNPPAGCTSQGC